MEIAIERVLEFTRLLVGLQAVRREVSVPGRIEHENDVEHSYQLAMMAWYLNESGRLGLDPDIFMRYGLIHDLAEVYAGDSHIFDHEGRVGKDEREAAALSRIASEFPEFPDLVELVHQYERQEDEESQFIYALDKLMPMLMIFLEGGTTWRELNFDIDWLMAYTDLKTSGSTVVQQLKRQLEQLIRAHPELFNEQNSTATST